MSCTHSNAYDGIDLADIGEDYLPRAVSRPGDRHGDLDRLHTAIGEWPDPALPGFLAYRKRRRRDVGAAPQRRKGPHLPSQYDEAGSRSRPPLRLLR